MAGAESPTADRHPGRTLTPQPLLQAGRTLRSASISSAANRILDYNPAAGVWQATGTAIAHAPNLTDLRSPDEVGFDFHGRSIHRSSTQVQTAVDNKLPRRATEPTIGGLGPLGEETIAGDSDDVSSRAKLDRDLSRDPLAGKVSWAESCKKWALVVWRFLCTPTGLFITIYGINVVAWGAMLFFLLLDVGPMSKERKEEWIEIDSQILNGLFCLTSWGLAPWRIRDTYWLLGWRFGNDQRSRRSIDQLAKRNASWFRKQQRGGPCFDEIPLPHKTLTGKIAPSTSEWKMDFVVVCMLLNTLFQVGMASFMWAYDRHTRPSYGVGLFIGLGCLSSLLAGIMSWWEGRKVKIIEGPFLDEGDIGHQEAKIGLP